MDLTFVTFAAADQAANAAKIANGINTILWLIGFPLMVFGLYRLFFGRKKGKSSKKSDAETSLYNKYRCSSAAMSDFILANIRNSHSRQQRSSAIGQYSYWPKKYMMTKREGEFFLRLNNIFGAKCYVVPQVMLSSLFDAKRNGQSTMGAWAHINRKSVDYALLSKNDLSIICAIELDDYTHDRENRKARDEEVERIFRETKLPLVRFRNISKLTDQDILKRIVDTYNSCQK